MTLHAVGVESVSAQRWRNGTGLTRELLTWPSAQAWGLRISVADIERDGPFSSYPGIERWFVVLEGAGVELRFEDDGEVHRVQPGDPPFRFDGARPVHCALPSGATRDLNVMAVRKRGRLVCEPVFEGCAAPRGDLRALYAHDGVSLVTAGGATELAPLSLVWSSEACNDDWHVRQPARAWWIAYRAGAQP
jgi:environmental stress-induced protein Ves